VSYGWKQEALAENAQKISDLGKELYERLATMADNWAGVGKNLGEAIGAYNRAVGSLENRVLVTARKFRDLEAAPEGKEIRELTPVDTAARALQAPEMLAPTKDSGRLTP
jgi:DNA recombination protein RmuC